MGNNSKSIRHQLRESLLEAYERELNRELKKLDQSFEEWRRGEICNGELSLRIHQYDRGPSKELYRRYNSGQDEMNIAYAIVVGILDEKDLSEELLEALDRPLSFYRSLKSRGDLRIPE
jgi:hypothetical protein